MNHTLSGAMTMCARGAENSVASGPACSGTLALFIWDKIPHYDQYKISQNLRTESHIAISTKISQNPLQNVRSADRSLVKCYLARRTETPQLTNGELVSGGKTGGTGFIQSAGSELCEKCLESVGFHVSTCRAGRERIFRKPGANESNFAPQVESSRGTCHQHAPSSAERGKKCHGNSIG